jgi:hypothetical protein
VACRAIESELKTEQVEVLREIFAEYISHVADDGCQMIGADHI